MQVLAGVHMQILAYILTIGISEDDSVCVCVLISAVWLLASVHVQIWVYTLEEMAPSKMMYTRLQTRSLSHGDTDRELP